MVSKQDIGYQVLYRELIEGRISRREFISKTLAIGLGAAGVSVLSSCAPAAATPTAAPAATAAAAVEVSKLTPTFYQWIIDLHPAIKNEINPGFGIETLIAPVEGADTAAFIVSAKNKQSNYDIYLGMTPFAEMASLADSGTIEPWDPYIPKDVLDDLIPSIREECTYKGKLYSWPFLLDVIVGAQNSTLTKKAGLPDSVPETWEEFLASSKTILDKGVARYGCTFDAHGWRSLIPVTHSVSTDCYYVMDGDKSGMQLFDFTSDPALQGLEIMKKMLEYSAANALQPGVTDGGINQTPDEIAFAAETAAYYIKYQNAPLRFAQKWGDKSALRMGPLPKPKGAKGSTVFWTTGCCLFTYGKNKEKAAEYMQKLTYNSQIWKDSIAGSASGHPGQMPPYKSIYAAWEKDKPDWVTKETWVPLVRGQLEVAKAIPNHSLGLQQNFIGQPIWEKYLKGEETDAKKVMQEAKDAVQAEVKKLA